MRITGPTLKVLADLLQNRDRTGADLMRSTRLASGTIYPILQRLEDNGWVSSEWPAPKRHLYRLTVTGRRRARAEFRALSSLYG